MFRVYLTNFGYYIDAEFDSLEAAKARGLKTGFEFVVYKRRYEKPWSNVVHDDIPIFAWSVFGGSHSMEY